MPNRLRRGLVRRGVRALRVVGGFDDDPAQRVHRRLKLRDIGRRLHGLTVAASVRLKKASDSPDGSVDLC